MDSDTTIHRTHIPKLAAAADTQINKIVKSCKFVSIASDGWSSLRNDSVLNYMAMTDRCNSFLLDAAAFKASHTGDNLFKDFKAKVMDRLTAIANDSNDDAEKFIKKLVAVVTDNASNVSCMHTMIVEV